MWIRFVAVVLVMTLAAPVQAQDARQLALRLQEAERYSNQGDTQRAIQSYQAALIEAKRVKGPQDVLVGVILNYIGNLHRKRGELREALPYLKDSLALYERLGAADLRAEASNNLAAAYMDAGELQEAKKLNEQALELVRQTSGPESSGYAVMLANLAIVNRLLGQGRDAEQQYLTSIRILLRYGEKQQTGLANSYMNLANLYQSQGELSKAEALYLEAIRLYEKQFNTEALEAARVRGNLASLYQSVGLWDKATAEHQRALKIYQAKLGGDNLDVARTLGNLATIAMHQKRPAEAEPLYRQVLATRLAKLGANHPDIALTRLVLGLALEELQRIPEARQELEASLRIRREIFAAESIQVADSLTALGLLEVHQGKLEQAERMLQETLKIRTAVLPDWHADVAMAHANLGVMYAVRQNWPAAANEFSTSRRSIRTYINQVLPGLADQDQVNFLRFSDEPHLHSALGLATQQPQDQQLLRATAEWLLNGKAVVQQSIAERTLLSRDRNDPQLKTLSAELQYVRKQLATLANQGGSQAAAQQKPLYDKERELSRQVTARSGRAAVAAWVGLDDVRKKLPPDGVFVNFVRWHVFDYEHGRPNEKQGDRYLAWVVRADSEEIQFLDLGECALIDQQITEMRTLLNKAPQLLPELGEKEAEAKLRGAMQPLTAAILKPLLSRFGKSQHLYLSPDSLLWLVPWCALPLDENQYVLEQYDLRYLVSGRELIEQSDTKAAGLPVLFANPEYDLEPSAVAAATREVFRQGPPAGQQQAIPSMKSRLGQVERLPGTMLEANAVQPSIKEFTSQDPQLYSDKYALEAVFKVLRQPRVLMLSTHGFFREASTEGAAAQGNPLLSCGLMLAGCNRPPAQLATTAEDGVLTALEIVETDLRGTELVVLSACETGLGTVRNGEGVAGLRQAFELAGARSVVSTLWSIPDRDSALIVVEFFNQLAGGIDKAAALRNAQLKRLQSRRDRSGAAHPFFWAAWTMTGG